MYLYLDHPSHSSPHSHPRQVVAPHKRVIFLFNREKGARDGNGEEKRDKHGQTNKLCFQFQNDYINYDAKNLKIKGIVQLVNFFISEFSASS
jgi:hypothetical protein